MTTTANMSYYYPSFNHSSLKIFILNGACKSFKLSQKLPNLFPTNFAVIFCQVDLSLLMHTLKSENVVTFENADVSPPT